MKKLDEEQFDQVFVYDNQMHGLLVEMTGMTRLYKAWKELNYGNIVTGFSLSTDKKRVLNTIRKRFQERDTWQGKYYTDQA